jgi:hypothetical protein
VTPVIHLAKLGELEAAAYALESMAGLFRRPGQHAHRVVAVTQDVVAGRETMLGAIDLHFIKLLDIKLVIADYAPIVRRRVHRETRRQRAIGANDQRVLSRATLPGWNLPPHQQFHVFHVLDGVDHLVAMIDSLVVKIVEQRINLGPVVRSQVSLVLSQVFEVILLGHGRFVDVVIRRNAAVMSNLSQFFNIVHIVMADVDIEHHGIAIITLPLDEIIEVRTDWLKRFWQRLSILN